MWINIRYFKGNQHLAGIKTAEEELKRICTAIIKAEYRIWVLEICTIFL